MKTIKLNTYYISDFFNKSTITVQGFESEFQKDHYFQERKSLLYYQEGILKYLDNLDSDRQYFKSKQEADNHLIKRKQHWKEWYQQQIKEYTEKLDKL